LIGDTADNIPGIKGIGPKRAAEILSYGTFDEILSGATAIPDKYFSKLKEHEEILKRNKVLIQMIDNVDIKLNDSLIAIEFDTSFKAKSIMTKI
jgi:DNA polymerase-1